MILLGPVTSHDDHGNAPASMACPSVWSRRAPGRVRCRSSGLGSASAGRRGLNPIQACGHRRRQAPDRTACRRSGGMAQTKLSGDHHRVDAGSSGSRAGTGARPSRTDVRSSLPRSVVMVMKVERLMGVPHDGRFIGRGSHPCTQRPPGPCPHTEGFAPPTGAQGSGSASRPIPAFLPRSPREQRRAVPGCAPQGLTAQFPVQHRAPTRSGHGRSSSPDSRFSAPG